jgi:hypothetical protein
MAEYEIDRVRNPEKYEGWLKRLFLI